jgi:hypothetical protein
MPETEAGRNLPAFTKSQGGYRVATRTETRNPWSQMKSLATSWALRDNDGVAALGPEAEPSPCPLQTGVGELPVPVDKLG